MGIEAHDFCLFLMYLISLKIHLVTVSYSSKFSLVSLVGIQCLSCQILMPVKLPCIFPYLVQTTQATDLIGRLAALGQERLPEHLTKDKCRADTGGNSPDPDSGMSSQSR